MPVEIKWDNAEQTILIVAFSGEITADELISAYGQMMDLMGPLDHTMVVIGDFRGVTRIPMNILSTSGAMSGRSTTNLAGLAVVGSNTVLKTVISVWSKLYKQMTMVNTLEEAYDWANKRLDSM